MSKYKAVKTEVDGILFDSKKEAKRYEVLRILEKSGEIHNLRLQQKFEIIPSFVGTDGARRRGTYYIADFTYYDRENKFIVEDVKGLKTDVYRLKKKLLAYKGVNISEV